MELELAHYPNSSNNPLKTSKGLFAFLSPSTPADNSFDLTMLLGPMYHLYTLEDKVRALSEAVRVTKPGGYILVAYCMNEPTIIQYVFLANHLKDVMETNTLLTEDWHCKSEPKEIF